MKKILIALISMAVLSAAAIAGEGAWLSDFEAAKAQAKAENKTILIDFTGSDWCGWCIKLQKEVFSKKEFQEYAKDKLILMEVDFPHEKKLSAKVKSQNDKLNDEFKVEGFPTLFLLDADGKKLSGELGYQEGGAAAYVEYLKKQLKK